MYVSYVNFLMISFVFLDSINHKPIREFLDENRLIAYPMVAIAFLLVCVVLGYADTFLGIRKEEIKNHSEQNVILMEILQTVKNE